MQFRCYACGYVFSEGLPPMEALSDQQVALVTGEVRTEVSDIRLILLQTNFAGMSPAQFCDECLCAIVDNPSAFGPHDEHRLEQDLSAVWCSCGVTYHAEDTGRCGKRDWVQINRLRMRHLSDAIA